MNDNVVIVGAGPAGLMLASELRLAGVETTVIDRRTEPRIDSPGVAINTSSVELLEARGLMDALQARTAPLPMVHFALLFLDTQALPTRHRNQVLVQQYELERALEKHATGLGAEIRRGHELVDIDADENGMTVGVRTATGDDEIRCRYLVGCDGPESTVRERLGISFTGTAAEYPFHGLIGDVEADVASLPSIQRMGVHYHPSGGIYMAVPLGPTALRVTTWESLDPAPDHDKAATIEELRAAIHRTTGIEFAHAGLRWLSRCENRIRQAERYRQGAVFLAGDAAQVIFPYNGQALNNALQDAANLGWKLAATINGWAPPNLLDTYHDERYAAGRRVAMNIHAQVALSRRKDEVGELRELFTEMVRFGDVNRYLVEMMTNLDVAYPAMKTALSDAEPHPLVGHRLPPVPLTTFGQETSTSHALRSGRGVVFDFTKGAYPLGDIKGWADRVDTISADPTPEIAAAILLCRPDGYIAWAADSQQTTSDEMRAALEAWFGAPEGA